jgi:hypothetical protein
MTHCAGSEVLLEPYFNVAVLAGAGDKALHHLITARQMMASVCWLTSGSSGNLLTTESSAFMPSLLTLKHPLYDASASVSTSTLLPGTKLY